MNIADYFGLIYILRYYIPLMSEGNLSGARIFELLRKVSPDILIADKISWKKQESPMSISYINDNVVDNKKSDYIKKFELYIGMYNSPGDELSGVYLDEAIFFKLEDINGNITDMRGRMMDTYGEVMNRREKFTYLRNIDETYKFINKDCFDNIILNELAPILIATKIKASL